MQTQKYSTHAYVCMHTDDIPHMLWHTYAAHTSHTCNEAYHMIPRNMSCMYAFCTMCCACTCACTCVVPVSSIFCMMIFFVFIARTAPASSSAKPDGRAHGAHEHIAHGEMTPCSMHHAHNGCPHMCATDDACASYPMLFHSPNCMMNTRYADMYTHA